MEYGTVPPPEQVSHEFQPDICSMFEIVVPVLGVGVGVGVGVTVVEELEELALVAGAEPELPQLEIKNTTTAIADIAVNP